MGDDVALGDENIPPIQDELFRLYSQGFVTDITLTCEDGKIFEAHKVILSARSNYFYNLIPKLKGDPVIFLKGVKGAYLEKILKYVYSGSAIVPRTQLRSLFDVARSLQIKGLTELSQGELGKNLPGSSCAKSMTMSPGGGGSKPDSDSFRFSPATREAREMALKQQQKLYDKFSSNSFKNKSNAKGSQTEAAKSPSKKGKGASKEMENHDEESFTFKYKHISDDSDDVDNDDVNDSDYEVQNKPGQAAKKYSRKKRSKPGKSELKPERKMSKSSSDGDTDSSDETNDEQSKRDYYSNSSESDSDSENSDIETGDSDSETKTHGRAKKEYSKLKKEPSPSLDDYYDAPAKRPYRRQQKGPAVNGQQILTVQCKGKRAELHLPRFCNGSKGKSVLYKNQWMTPDDYEKACGSKAKKYLDTITTDYGPLKTLTISGLLKPHAKKCKCNECNDEQPEATKSTKNEKAQALAEETQDKLSKNIPDERESEENKNIAKRKKSETEETNKKAKLGLNENTVKDSSSAATLKEEAKTETEKVLAEEKGKLTIQPSSPVKSQNFKSGEIISPPTLTTTKPTTTLPTTSVMTNISTFSPSSTDSLSPTFISLSTAAQISPKTSSLGSSMIPFPSKLSGIPSPSSASVTAQKSAVQTGSSQSSFSTTTSSLQTTPALSHAKFETKPQVHSQQTKPQIAIQMGPPKLDSASIMSPGLQMSQAQHQGSFQMQRSRLGAVMQVRCKAVSAYLYTNKYESGSKGKCIMLGEEWLTPNEFEEKSGSKAKKYLSSIKCLGRPLRAYVNSGELRGSGPPPSPKPPRMTKPKPPQPIAPAPAPGQSHGQLNMSQISMPGNPGMSSGHLAQSYTPVAMMGGVSVAGQPILINQSSFSVANSMANTGINQSNLGTPILAPMTFTLAPMSGMDQRQGMGVQQMHNSHHM